MSSASRAASRISSISNVFQHSTEQDDFGTKKHRVAVIGSGNWGTAIAKIVAENTREHSDLFEPEVRMWVFEEEVQLARDSKHYDPKSELSSTKQKLSRLINTYHENVKYLPGISLPQNLVGDPDLLHSVKDATILIFNMPHQFISGICKQLKGNILPFARAISCIKGVNVKPDGIQLFHETIGEELGIFCGALSGANIANEVASEKFSETTIAYLPPPVDAFTGESGHVSLDSDLRHEDAWGKKSNVKLVGLPTRYLNIDGDLIKKLFYRPYFHVRIIEDSAGVSLGGALKNIVALAAGFVDGKGWGDNAKAAVMRIGLLEMVKFGRLFFEKTVQPATFTQESCGVADLITSCSGGRNHRCAKLSVERGVPIAEVEKMELNGQSLQGTLTAVEVHEFLKRQNMTKDFPLFTAVYNILHGKEKVENLPDLLK